MSMIHCVRCGALIDTDYNTNHTEEVEGHCELDNN